MLYLVITLRLACFVSFWLGVPLLLAVRARSKLPWWLVTASVMILGWVFTNGAVFFQHRVADEADRRASRCFDNAIHGDQNVTVLKGDGIAETVVENPCGVGDLLLDSYKPFKGLLYGPLYLLCCSLPYWLIVVRRASRGRIREIVSIAVAVFVIEWATIFVKCFVYEDQMCSQVDPYVLSSLTIAAASLVSWVIAVRIPRRFGRSA
jgi:hypothetical protein